MIGLTRTHKQQARIKSRTPSVQRRNEMNQTTWMPSIAQVKPQLQPWVLPAPAVEWNSSPSGLADLLAGFAPISLKEMDSVALLNRVDTKFVMPTANLFGALSTLQPDYRVLAVQGQRMNHYRTLYFDTPDFELYHLHVNGRAERYKVRSREYLDSQISFLEVKHKTRKDRTVKSRISTDQPVVWMTTEAKQWLEGVLPYDSRGLEPKIWNTFRRITLVSKQDCERVTIDVDLVFYTAHKTVRLEGIAIAEVKLGERNQSSPFLASMRAQKIHPQGFSKYCIGTSLLVEQVKKNRLKPKLMWIEKISKGSDK